MSGWKSGLVLAIRVLLGALFVYAAAGKILDPPAFAKEIFGYKILPSSAVNLMAIMLPWVELVAGLALVFGVWVRSAAALVTALLVVFITAISVRFARGETDFACGCFPHGAELAELPVVGPVIDFLVTSTKARVTLARDVVFLAGALVVLRAPEGRKEKEKEPEPRG